MEWDAMKAAILFGNEDIRFADMSEPETRPGAVKVRVRACGICDPQLVFRKFPLTRVAEAFDLFRNPSQVHGKVMLMCGDDA